MGRNKKCITLKLNEPEGRDLVLELVRDADLVVENFRPGTLEKWGLGYDQLQDVNPGIIMVRISGYGQDGPHSSKPGFGTVAEGRSGWAYLNGFPDRKPLLPPISLADLTAAQFAVQSAMSAVYERDHSDRGRGQVVDISLYEPLFRLFLGDVEKYAHTGDISQPLGNKHPYAAPRGVYTTQDRYVVLSAPSQRAFENVMEAIGRPELADDPRFETNQKRVENADRLDEYIESWTEKRTRRDVIDTMESYDVIVGPVYHMGDIFEDEQYRARNNIVELEDEEVGSLTTQGVIPHFSRTPGSVRHAGAAHGAHNEEVFLDESELNLPPSRYETLKQKGVI